MRRAVAAVAGPSRCRNAVSSAWPLPNPIYTLPRHRLPPSSTSLFSHLSRDQRLPSKAQEDRKIDISHDEAMQTVALSIPEHFTDTERLRIAFRAFHHPHGSKVYHASTDEILQEAYTHPDPPEELKDLPRGRYDNSHLVQVGIASLRLWGWLHARESGRGLSLEEMARSVDELVSTANLHSIATRLQWPRILHFSPSAQQASTSFMARTAAALFGVVHLSRSFEDVRLALDRQLAFVPLRSGEPLSLDEESSIKGPSALPDPIPPSPLVPPDVRPLTLGERAILVRNVTTSHFNDPNHLRAFVEAITHSGPADARGKASNRLDNRVMARIGDAAMRAVLWEWLYLFHRDVPVEILAEEVEYRLRDEVLLELAEDMYWRQILLFHTSFHSPPPSDLSLALSLTRSTFGAILVARDYSRLISCMRMLGLLSNELRSPKGREAQKALAERGIPQGPGQRPRPVSKNVRWRPLKMSRSPGTEPIVVDYLDYGAASGHDQTLEPIVRDFDPFKPWEVLGTAVSTEPDPSPSPSELEPEPELKDLTDAERTEMLVAGLDTNDAPAVPDHWLGPANGSGRKTIDQMMAEINKQAGPEWMRASRQEGIRQVLKWQQSRKAVGPAWTGRPAPADSPVELRSEEKSKDEFDEDFASDFADGGPRRNSGALSTSTSSDERNLLDHYRPERPSRAPRKAPLKQKKLKRRPTNRPPTSR